MLSDGQAKLCELVHLQRSLLLIVWGKLELAGLDGPQIFTVSDSYTGTISQYGKDSFP